MNEKLGVVEFFTMEASEYLERLDALVTREDAPDVREFQRLTRALRGAAIMANQHTIAGACGAFEQVARALRDGSRQWDEATRLLATRAVDDLKIFIRRVRDWSDTDTQKARDLTAALEAAVGRPSRGSRIEEPSGPDSGTRAFIAREGASLAGTLDRAAKALATNPLAHEPLQQVLNVMQPLRGLASLADLPPMPDLLEGIERAVGEAARAEEAGPLAGEVFGAAAEALTEATKAVAADGKADPESPVVRRFADLLDRFLEFDRTIVPIQSLYHDDEGPHIVEQGTAPASRERLGDVELVSHGEHLRSVADGLDRADTTVQRQLRVQGLAGTFRALEEGAGGALSRAAAGFAGAARNAIAADRAMHDPARFAQILREAGNVLSQAASGDEEQLASELDEVTGQLEAAEGVGAGGGGGGGDTPERDAVTEPAAPRRPMAPSAAAPAPSPAPSPPSPPGGGAAAGADEPADLAGSWLRYERYLSALGLGPSSLDELLAGPPADPRAAGGELPPISDFVYDSAGAVARARELRSEIAEALGRGETPRELIEELLDLVDLGLGAAR